MKTDPRKGCANLRELWVWAAIHDLLAHPFMVLTLYSRLSLRFHDFTSHRAWPRPVRPAAITVVTPTRFGDVRVTQQAEGVWSVYHGRVNHAITLASLSPEDALYKALKWFDSLGEEFGGKFAPGGAHG